MYPKYRIEVWDASRNTYDVVWEANCKIERAEIQLNKPYYPPTKRLIRVTEEILQIIRK